MKMKSFKEFISLFRQPVTLHEAEDIINLVTTKSISFDEMPIFIDTFKVELAESLTIMNDARGLVFEFYNFVDKIGFLNYLAEEMVFKASIDQTSRDNIFLTVFEPKSYKGISKIELISREGIDYHNIQMKEIEAVSIVINCSVN